MAQPDLQPDLHEIGAHLSHITRRWHELDTPCLLEVVFLTDDDKAEVRDVRRYRLDQLQEAVEHVAGMNRHRLNAYATVNPVDARAEIGVTKRASGEHIAASFFHWADADSAEAAANIQNFVGPKATFGVITGTQPAQRPHVYWELEHPTHDLGAWSQTQRNIAAILRTDPAVIDPPRIMRIGGTINWPKPQKAAKGYVAERTNLVIYDGAERPPIPAERMRKAFPPIAAPAAGAGMIDTGGHDRRSADDYAEMLNRARTDGEKHAGVRDLAASLAGQGIKRELAEAIIRQACPVWDDNVEALIASAYAKYWKPQEALAAAQEPGEAFDTAPITLGELRSVQPRRWLYGRKMLRGFCSVLAAPGGTSKSAWAAAVARDMAEGDDTLHDAPHAPLKVWIYNLEDPRDETIRKLEALRRAKGLSDEALQRLIVTSGRDRSLIVADEVERGIFVATPDVTLMIEACKASGVDALIVDPAVRAHRLPENDNKAVDVMMDQFARIAHEADISVLLIHHTRKGFVGGEMDSFRGASSMTSAARVAITMQAMSREEAADMNIPDVERRFFVRIENAKANLAPPPEKAEWIKLENQPLDNGSDDYPDGDHVQVVTKWQPPNPWDNVGPKLMEIFDRIDRGAIAEDGSARPYAMHKNSGDRWIVNAILPSFEPGEKTEAQCKAIARNWIERGFLEERKVRDPVSRKEVVGVVVANRPEGGADE